MTKKAHPHLQAIRALRTYALSLPEAHTKSPWPGHLDGAVRDKTFAYLSLDNEPLRISCKLPNSQPLALGFSFATPTGYGLGKSGWVTATFAAEETIPVPLLREWILESYGAVAPKKLVKLLEASKAGAAKSSVLKSPSEKPSSRGPRKKTREGTLAAKSRSSSSATPKTSATKAKVRKANVSGAKVGSVKPPSGKSSTKPAATTAKKKAARI